MNAPWPMRLVRAAAVPIIVAWVLAAAALTLGAPWLERTITENSQAVVPNDAPSVEALQRAGAAFGESTTDNLAALVMEADRTLSGSDKEYYAALMDRLQADRTVVESVYDFWSAPLTATAGLSQDEKAVYAFLRLAGSMGSTESATALAHVREVVAESTPPDGLQVFVGGPGPVIADELHEGDRSMIRLMLVTAVLITFILLIVYRSPTTVALPLITVGLALAVSRAVVSLLGDSGIIEVSIFSSALLAGLVLGAGTDYGIFLLGRYHEARRAGHDPTRAYFDAMAGVWHVILGSGLCVAGACATLVFTRLGMYRSAGLACAISVLITIAAALTLAPAILMVGSKFGLFDPRPQRGRQRLWFRIGTLSARWPVPVLAASLVVLAVGIAAVPTLRTSYDDPGMIPDSEGSIQAYQAADRHFPSNRLSPDFVIIESDHDLRNSADLIAVDKVAAALFQVDGVALVQSVTRPLGTPLDQASLTSQAGYVGSRVDQATLVLRDQLDNLRTLSDLASRLSGSIGHLAEVTDAMADSTDGLAHDVAQLSSTTDAITRDVDSIAAAAAPVRELAARPECRSIEQCRALGSSLQALDEVGALGGSIQGMAASAATLDANVGELGPEFAQFQSMTRQLGSFADQLHTALDSVLPAVAQITNYTSEIGRSFATGAGGQFFYMPPEALDSPAFQQILPLFFAEDGKTVRFFVTPTDAAFSEAAATMSQNAKLAAVAAIKGTSLMGSTVTSGGVASAMADLRDANDTDFTLIVISVLTMVFVVVLVMLRSLIAAITVVGTVVVSYLAAVGFSGFVWQNILGTDLYWMVEPMSFMILVAVGSDYNLLLAARFREERHLGTGTAIIRSMGKTGGIVTTAGLVFGLTMLAMTSATVVHIMQIGVTTGIGLLLDTLLVRAFVVPAIARGLGPWFWWPRSIFEPQEKLTLSG